jgi:hypothetical protein
MGFIPDVFWGVAYAGVECMNNVIHPSGYVTAVAPYRDA